MSDSARQPRAYGATLRPDWPLDPDITYLNHGGYGVAPRRVLAEQAAWRARIEANPMRFMQEELTPLQRAAAATLAGYLKVRGEDLVFVENATAGCNAVLRSLPLHAGDEVLVTDHIYGGLVAAATHLSQMAGATVRTVDVPFPAFDAADAVERVSQALTDRTRLVIIEHVAADTAVVWPVAEIVRACRAKGVPVLVDGAHVLTLLEEPA